jgi:hypothetical protein
MGNHLVRSLRLVDTVHSKADEEDAMDIDEPVIPETQKAVLREISRFTLLSMYGQVVDHILKPGLGEASLLLQSGGGGEGGDPKSWNLKHPYLFSLETETIRQQTIHTRLMLRRDPLDVRPYIDSTIPRKQFVVTLIQSNVPGLGVGGQLIHLLKQSITLQPDSYHDIVLEEVYFPSFWVIDSDFGWSLKLRSKSKHVKEDDEIEPIRFFKRHLYQDTPQERLENTTSDLHPVDLWWSTPIERVRARRPPRELLIALEALNHHLSGLNEFTSSQRAIQVGPYTVVSHLVDHILGPNQAWLAPKLVKTCRLLGNLDFTDDINSTPTLSSDHVLRYVAPNALEHVRALVWEATKGVENTEEKKLFLSFLIDYGRTLFRPVFVNKAIFGDVEYPLGTSEEQIRDYTAISPHFLSLENSQYLIWCPQRRPHTTDKHTGTQIIPLPLLEVPLKFNEVAVHSPGTSPMDLTQCVNCQTLSRFHDRDQAFHFCDNHCRVQYYYHAMDE